MANTTSAESLVNVSLSRQEYDLNGNGTLFARGLAVLPGKQGKVGKCYNIKAVAHATVPTTNVVTVTLPTGTYMVSVKVLTASATAAIGFGADTPALNAPAYNASVTMTAGVGFAVYTGDTPVDLLVPEGQTSLKFVADTNSTAVLISAYVL